MTTLQEFIATKPPELRLGQYFYNTFFKCLKPEDNTHKSMDLLFYTTSEKTAEDVIKEIMKAYQWEELPDVHN